MDWWKRLLSLFEDSEKNSRSYVFKTTIERDLKTIVETILPKYDIRDFPDFKEWRRLGHVSFATERWTKEKARNNLGFKSLKFDWKIDHYIKWEVDYDEYCETYYSAENEFFKDYAKNLLSIVSENIKNEDYNYIFNRYEDSIHILASTVIDSANLNGDVSADIKKRSEKIIRVFGEALYKRESEIAMLSRMDKDAANKSHVNRLDAEIDFMDEYLNI